METIVFVRYIWYQWIGMSDVFGDTFVFEKKKRGEVGKEGHFCI